MSQESSQVSNSTERIESLELHIGILKEHLEKHKHKTEPEAAEFMEEKIKKFEQEINIRKAFSN